MRPARRADADALAAAHIEGWRVGYRGLVPDAFLDADEFASTRLERWRAWTWPSDGNETFVVEVDGRVVGFGIVGPARLPDEPPVPTGEVYAFYLHPDAWGSGAATALMTRCHQFLIEAGYVGAILWVLRDNPRARAFYAKAGWAPTGATTLFTGPQTAAALPEPLVEVQYAVNLEMVR